MPITNALAQRPANMLAYQDTLSATPRNEYLGALADLIAQSYSPQRTQQMQGTARFLSMPAISQTLDRLSYGEPLTTGAGGLGGTTRIRPEALEAAMAVAPVAQPATMATLQAARAARQAALQAGRAGERYAERVVPGIMERGGLPAEMLTAMAGQPSRALPQQGRSGFGAFDPRYDPRKKEQARLQAMTREIELNPNAQSGPIVSLADFEGRPFITSMSDRTAAGGRLVGIDDVAFNRPVELMGGQDYMFNNPGQVWASAQGPVKQLLKQANAIKKATGEDPLYMPWRMAPTGGDFAAMTGETMLSYADAAMGKSQKMALDKSIKNLIPDWAGVSNPASVEQFRGAKDKTRKAIKKLMDVNFREEGGLNIGGARLAVSDPTQLNAQTGGVMNVGEIFTGRPMVMESGHPSYPRGVPGQGLGTLAEDRNIFELLPEVAKARGIPDPMNPRTTDIRALQMKPYAGVITNELLKRLGY
tara:strand:+ start:305 stop:1732 length:1428 start_codon:yes stop_codon:yes gene_type:complete